MINHHMDVPYRVLEHQYGFDNGKQRGQETQSGNKIIHGDNLEALKALLPEYEGRIKCIYIDPPYNTGEEKWKYNDNVNDPRILSWLGRVVGRESDDLTRHDKWLCMMYPRLKLLHKLLAPEGVIFVSINFIDEYSHLRCILDEIFGKSNYIGEITWESTTQPINSGSARFGLQQKVEPITFYAKDKRNQKGFILQEIDTGLRYPHDGLLGKCRFEIIEKSDAGSYERNTMKFKILGQGPRPGKRWQIGQDTAIELESNNRLEIVDGIIKKAVYPEDEIDRRKFIPFWSHYTASQVGTAQSGKDILNEVMNESLGFDTVKPPSLILELISHFSSDAIILDSFAGSGTTAHAVLNLNKQDGGKRKVILIEMEDYADSITAERVKRVIKGYGDTEGTGGAFDYYTLGQPMFLEDGMLNELVGEEKIREYVYYTETNTPLQQSSHKDNDYFLNKHNDTSYYFYYEQDGITTLDHEFLSTMKTKAEQYVIYADNCLLTKQYMTKHNIIFKKIPRDITRF